MAMLYDRVWKIKINKKNKISEVAEVEKIQNWKERKKKKDTEHWYNEPFELCLYGGKIKYSKS